MIKFSPKANIKKGADMKKAVQIRRKSKVKKAKAVEVMQLRQNGALDMDSKVALIQLPYVRCKFQR